MVVRWFAGAEKSLKDIFDYHRDVAGYKTAMKIVGNIRDSADSLATMPQMAPVEPSLEEEPELFRALVVDRRYKVVYFTENETIKIADIWDCRRDPETLTETVRKTKA